jgi:hypothetical protein
MAGLNKTQLRREIIKAQREQFKARLGELRGLIAAARVAKKEAIKAVQTDCAAKRIAAREMCALRAAEARQRGSADVAAKRSQLKQEQVFEKQIAGYDRPKRLRSTSKERAQESDDAVRANLPPEMVRVFDAVRKHIKGGPRKTRTEAFFEWAEENPDEVWSMMQHQAERDLAALLAEQERTTKAYKRARAGRSAVPF